MNYIQYKFKDDTESIFLSRNRTPHLYLLRNKILYVRQQTRLYFEFPTIPNTTSISYWLWVVVLKQHCNFFLHYFQYLSRKDTMFDNTIFIEPTYDIIMWHWWYILQSYICIGQLLYKIAGCKICTTLCYKCAIFCLWIITWKNSW